MKEPTESQKFRANVLITLIGSVLCAIIIGLFLSRMQRQAERADREAAQQAINQAAEREHRQRFTEARNLAIKTFTEKFPRSAYLAYQMSCGGAKLAARPMDARDDDLCPLGGGTWQSLSADHNVVREKLTEWGDAAGPCLVLEAYLHSPAAVDAIRKLRQKVSAMVDTTDPAKVETLFAEINTTYDETILAVSKELHGETLSPPTR